jgi:hypothetical protein
LNDAKTFLEPLAGLLLDEISKLRNSPFVPHSLTKLRNISTLQKLTGAKEVIEIGTYKGVTTSRLARIFDKVTSVEIDRELYEGSRTRLQRLDNVVLLLGDGKELIREASSTANNAILFLDGHFSGGETGIGDKPEPVLKELDEIRDNIGNIAGILIDDFRLFGVEQGWPLKSVLLNKIEHELPPEEWNHLVMNDQVLCYRKAG